MSGSPELLLDELLYEIREQIAAHPRSQQKRIGPSEIGEPCARKLAYKLADVPEVRERGDEWLPTIGTAVHTWLEGALTATNERWVADSGAPRFLLEHRVTVGQIAGQDVTGATDAYDTVTATVIDWKIVGPTTLKRVRSKGPGATYRTQGHTYGRGWKAAGHPVDTILVVFLPRNGPLTDAVIWHEPFDETVADEALARANRLDALVKVLGDEAWTISNDALLGRGLHMLADPEHADGPAMPTDGDSCRFCPWLGGGVNPAASCGGDAARAQANAAKTAKAFEGLIA